MTFGQEIVAITKMPYGPARTAAAESVVRRIEAESAHQVLAWALAELVEAYVFDGHGEQAFVAFSRMLRVWDENPELFDEQDVRNLFWEYKWIASEVCNFPQISRAQVEAFFDDMERRFSLQGLGLSAVMVSRFNWAHSSGAADAEERRLAWRSTPSDDFEDCPACVIGTQVAFFVDEGRFDEALALGLTQHSTCSVEPAQTYYAMSMAAAMSGRPADAVTYHRLAVANFAGKPRELARSRGRSFEVLARGGQLERALRSLRHEHAELMEDAGSPLAQLGFWMGLLAGLSANLDHGDLATGLPGAGQGTVAELHGWVLARALPLAQDFDRRNGNTYYIDWLQEALAATRSAETLDFSVDTMMIDDDAERGLSSTSRGGSTSEAGSPGDGEAATGESITNGESGTKSETRIAEADPFARAEVLAARGEYAQASALYQKAAASSEARGLLAEAGISYAEAAQCVALADDEDRAHELFGKAAALLAAGEANHDVTLRVLNAWAPVAARIGDMDALISALTSLRTMGMQPIVTEHVSEDLAQRERRTRALLLAATRDLLARCVAVRAPEQAIEDAVAAAHEFASLGQPRHSAQARWLAARLYRDTGNTIDAIASYELALGGMTGDSRAEAAGELMTLFREAGLPEQADQVLERFGI